MNLLGGGLEWSQLNPSLSMDTMKTIEKLGFNTMTPVQSSSIPLFLTNKDVLVEACTGSGKTLAFIIPIIEILKKRESSVLLKKTDITSIIISPTRELATQTYQVLQQFINPEISTHLNEKEIKENEDSDDDEEEIKRNKFIPTSILLIGGTPIYDDIQKFNKDGGNIIVGTPGRIDEFMSRIDKDQLKVKQFEVLILDEADRLLDMGFHLTINSILSRIPKQRRTGLFSATQTSDLKELARTGMRNPVKVSITVQTKDTLEVQSIPTTLKNLYTLCPLEDKFNQLVHFLVEHIDRFKIIVYFLTCADVDYFYRVVKELKVMKDKSLFSLHGKAPHEKRQLIFDEYSKVASGALFATDLASRGLDIPNIDWVVQYDAPQDPKAFVHRIGRTARIGRDGNALLFLTPEEDTYIEFNKLRKVPLEERVAPVVETNYLAQMKKIVLSDRDIMEKGIVAFVSHTRAYHEHQCSYIFVIHRLDMFKLATGYALLRLPAMPEFKNKAEAILEWSSGVTLEQIEKVPYKDKKREKQRKSKLLNDKKVKEEKQIEKENQKKLEKELEAKKKEEEEELEKQRQLEEQQTKKKKSDLLTKRERDELQAQKDIDEIDKDFKAHKKMRKGKISKNKYDEDDEELERQIEMEIKGVEDKKDKDSKENKDNKDNKTATTTANKNKKQKVETNDKKKFKNNKNIKQSRQKKLSKRK